jgi:type I restriction enzyme M protein
VRPSSFLIQRLRNYCNILRDDGLSYGDYLEHLNFFLFLKMADEQSRPPFIKKSPIPEKYSWPEPLKRDGDEPEIREDLQAALAQFPEIAADPNK